MKNPWRESCTATPKFCPEEEIDLRADLQQGQNFDVQSSGERGRGRPARDDVEYRNVYVAPKSRNDVPLPAEVVAWMRENGEWALWEGGTGGTKSARSNYTQANAMKARSGRFRFLVGHHRPGGYVVGLGMTCSCAKKKLVETDLEEPAPNRGREATSSVRKHSTNFLELDVTRKQSEHHTLEKKAEKIAKLRDDSSRSTTPLASPSAEPGAVSAKKDLPSDEAEQLPSEAAAAAEAGRGPVPAEKDLPRVEAEELPTPSEAAKPKHPDDQAPDYSS
eukprot:g7659.t1